MRGWACLSTAYRREKDAEAAAVTEVGAVGVGSGRRARLSGGGVARVPEAVAREHPLFVVHVGHQAPAHEGGRGVGARRRSVGGRHRSHKGKGEARRREAQSVRHKQGTSGTAAHAQSDAKRAGFALGKVRKRAPNESDSESDCPTIFLTLIAQPFKKNMEFPALGRCCAAASCGQLGVCA